MKWKSNYEHTRTFMDKTLPQIEEVKDAEEGE
jgi:hypothetical protein